ncbi:MAG: HDOD domain-containing protein, partial [Nitrospira sp.]|nr:HDOD domain-containing protein [Nitrospira sp.]
FSAAFTLPEIYFRVKEIVDSPDSSMDDLANVLKFDPAIAAKILQIVNSPLYGFPRQVDTMTRAVNIIGMQAVSDLVTAMTVSRTFVGMTSDVFDLPAYWRKSVLCALLADKAAKTCGIEESERFFIEGLLRDIGHLVLYQALPQQAQAALIDSRRSDMSLAQAEYASMGFNFSTVGAELIRAWAMPAHIEQAIRYQLYPTEAKEFALHASVVALAGAIADHAESAQSPADQFAPFPVHSLPLTQFNAQAQRALLNDAQAQLQDVLALISPHAVAA